MQRRESGRGVEPPQHRLINQAMLPQVRTTVNNAVSDGNRRRQFAASKNLFDPANRIPLGGDGYCLGEQRVRLRIRAWNLPPSSPIDCASPESNASVRDALARYKPNFREDEPLFSARMIVPE